jgi:hypothetical protein
MIESMIERLVRCHKGGSPDPPKPPPPPPPPPAEMTAAQNVARLESIARALRPREGFASTIITGAASVARQRVQRQAAEEARIAATRGPNAPGLPSPSAEIGLTTILGRGRQAQQTLVRPPLQSALLSGAPPTIARGTPRTNRTLV